MFKIWALLQKQGRAKLLLDPSLNRLGLGVPSADALSIMIVAPYVS